MTKILDDLDLLITLNEDDFDRGKGKFILWEFIKEERNKQLSIAVVNQQRELLLAYHRHLTEELSLDIKELWVDEHLKANNCG